MTKQQPKIGVIGSGYWGKNLVRNFHTLGALGAICDKDPGLLAKFQEMYPGIPMSLDFRNLLDGSGPLIDAIVIATPAETHYTLARQAFLAGKHVYVEKPMSLREEEGEELISLASEKKRVLLVGHVVQYHPAFVRIKELATSGELGRINYICSHRLNLGKIRREENIPWSFAPHDISMILALVGEEPESVLATGCNYLHQKIADITSTHLEFPSGLRAHIFVSWLHPFKEQKLVVVGDRKMAVFDDAQPWLDKLLLYPHEIKWHNNVPVPAKAEPKRFDISQAEPLRLECEHFIDCISDGKKPLTDGHEGLRVLKILNASQRSLDQDGQKIRFGNETKEDTERNSIYQSAIPNPQSAMEPRQSSSGDDVFIHPTAVIDDQVVLGRGCRIWHFSHILPGSKIGERCNIGQNVVIGPDVTIGNGCKIQNNVCVYKGVTLEDGIFCGPSMVFTNVSNPRAEIRKMDEARSTLVKKGATIGANATIICNTTIGRYCFIGAGAVVTKDVPDHALVVGNSARQIGWACECGERLMDDLNCLSCGKKYKTNAHGIEPIAAR